MSVSTFEIQTMLCIDTTGNCHYKVTVIVHNMKLIIHMVCMRIGFVRCHIAIERSLSSLKNKCKGYLKFAKYILNRTFFPKKNWNRTNLPREKGFLSQLDTLPWRATISETCDVLWRIDVFISCKTSLFTSAA